MKKILTFCFLSCSLLSLAQGPVVEGTYLPVRGTSVKQIWDTSSVFTIPTGGPNQSWDYSTQFNNVVDTFQIRTFHPNSTPYNQYFPAATHASFLRTPFDNASDSLYSYFIIDMEGVHNLGGFNIKKSYDTSAIMNPSEFMLPFSCSYGMLKNDTSKSVAYANLGLPVKIKQTKFKIMNGYGYGTLKTPVNTFNNTLLAREDVTTRDSIFVDFTSSGNYTYWQTQVTTIVAYAFIRNNTFGSSYVMHLTANAANTVVDFGWYALPVDCGSISGTVYDSIGGGITTQGEALLYRENSNFAKNDILDRTLLDVNGNYLFDSIPYGEYRIAIRPDAVAYPTALTTYYGDTTDWLVATPIITAGVPVSSGKDIHLQYQPVAPGIGNINGNLSLDLSVRASDPIPGVDVIVKKNPGGNAIQEVKTDPFGDFALNTVPDGNYTIFVDIPGLHMAGTYNFTISGGTLLNALDFTVGTDSIHPDNLIVTTITEQRRNNDLMNAYPNPYSTNTTISINITEKCDLLLEVYNVLGEKVQTLDNSQKQSGTYFYNFNAKGVGHSSGIYFIKLSAGSKNSVIKIAEQ